MLDLLNKYYEYFLKLNLEDKNNLDEEAKFENFHKIIINEYDLSNDSELRKDINQFFNFFDSVNFLYRYRGRFHCSSELEEERKRFLFQRYNCSFDFFKPTEYMVHDDNFLYSIKSAKENIFCKVYLSIKPDKYVATMIKLQDFVNQLYINHPGENIGQCKFRKVPSNDAIVMRFADRQHYNEFLQYLNKNPDITASFDTPNPFIPRDLQGLPIIPDNLGSYIYFVTKMIWDYMKGCQERNKKISIEELVSFIDSYDCSNDEMLYKNGDDFINYYKIILTGKLLGKMDTEILQCVFNDTKEKNSKLI